MHDVQRSTQDTEDAQLGYAATLLDEVFINAVPAARRLLTLIEQRGWTGWTKVKRIGP